MNFISGQLISKTNSIYKTHGHFISKLFCDRARLYPRHTGPGFYYVLTTLSKKARAYWEPDERGGNGVSVVEAW